MKNYNKILEAVNRGIKFALDDFDNNEEIQGQSNSKVKYQGGTKEWLDLMSDVVDLGLPSGTLWCKYNLDVNPNQLTSARDWYGGYYAWGEIDPKQKYTWDNYKFIHLNKLTKYNEEDKLTELLPEDDAAYQNKHIGNFKFHIPTKEQCEELINYTKNYWVNNYDPNKLIHNPEDDKGIQGLNGGVFEAKNGNQLFIPAADRHINSGVGTNCYLWSSSINIDYPILVYYLYFHPNNIDIYANDHRYDGYSIRPVINL